MFWLTVCHVGTVPPSTATSVRSVPALTGRSSAWARLGRSLYRPIGLEYVGGSGAGSIRRTNESSGRSWRRFRRLMGYRGCSGSSGTESSTAWTLIEFASWCCLSESNLANSISGKFAAVQYFHRLRVGVELPVTAPVVQCALKGIARSHVSAGTPCRVRLPVSFGMILTGGIFIPSWGPEGRVVWLCFTSVVFSIGTIGRDVRRRFRGGAPRALPDAG